MVDDCALLYVMVCTVYCVEGNERGWGAWWRHTGLENWMEKELKKTQRATRMGSGISILLKICAVLHHRPHGNRATVTKTRNSATAEKQRVSCPRGGG